MDKSVVISAGKKLDISNSIVHEDFSEYPNLLMLAEGVAVFNDKMELLPLISDFLTHYRQNHSDKSVQTYANNLRYLVEYLTTHDENHIDSSRDNCLLTVHVNEIQRYFSYCKSDKDKNGKIKQAISGKTIANRDATYGKFFNEFLCNPPSGYKLIRSENPYENGKLAVHAKNTLIKPALFSDIEALILVANYEREKCLIQFMYDTGVRRQEVEDVEQGSIAQLSRSSRKSIIEDDGTIKIPSEYHAMEIKGNKGRGREAKYRETVVSKVTINRVQRYHSSIEYKRHKRKWVGSSLPAFLNADGNPYTASAVSKLIKKLSDRALKLGLIKTIISPHKIRHGFGAMLLNSDDFGKSQLDRLLLLQQCLGHGSLETTQVYTKIPVGVWEKFVDRKTGVELKRHELMKKLKDRTKAKKGRSN
ncbi:tyrosine-type recombinase/integrase [Aliivibrio sp. A6]|uniref:tyrosine-type recombinase/integrase n=1 Tax=Aliivibrio sp. A6 TaxID=3028427 RepID=UPI002378A7E9|nr:tyrosine-type recombinase/integrase [Aliivibrio sp. A6]MDD9177465.1 tyrosine-type recombinase/integrase [Aliivibrio sp. A6]